jgi:uncharacterized membrane protein
VPVPGGAQGRRPEGTGGGSASSTTFTADWQAQAAPATPEWLVRPLHTIEGSASLDGPVGVLARLSDAVLPSPRVEGLLRGENLGHALHPLLTDFPLGSWLSATLLDLFGGRRARPAATGLVGFGLAMAVPTAAAGLAEWRAAGEAPRRVGVVHAAVNGAATALYAASFLARLRGRHHRGVALALAGGSAAWVGGYFGGHLSLVRKVGTADPSYGPGPARPTLP